MCFKPAMKDGDSKEALKADGLRIRDARKRASLTQDQLAQRLGVKQSVVSDWERGELASWKDYIPELTRALNLLPSYFAAGTTRASESQPVRYAEVVGEVQGGTFRLAVEYPPEDRFMLPAIPSPGYDRVPLRYLRVVGDSVNLLYPDGTFVLVVSTADTDVRSGDRVVVYSRQGELREATIKEIRVEPDGRIALWPRSTHPDHQEPIYLEAEEQDGPEIAYVVVGSYRPEERPPVPIQLAARRRG